MAAAGIGGFLVGCGGSGSGGPKPALSAALWPEAETPFQNDPKWIGGDSAYSIDLGGGRVLWLFGDSFIANTAARLRSDSVIVRNAIAIQTGYDLTSASLRFYWNVAGPQASSFFAAPSGSTWLWPGDGALVGERLILFQNQIASSSGGLGFQSVDWSAVAVENPASDPTQWTLTPLQTQMQFNLTLGSAVIVVDGYLYAASAGLTQPGTTYMARWPVSALSGNSLLNPEWYAGTLGWATADQLSHGPSAVANIGQSEFTIETFEPKEPYLVIQTSGFGGASIAYQTAQAISGPYSGARTFFNPPEASQSDILIYSAKMHPEQSAPGSSLVATYCTNSTDFTTQVNDMSLYFPRFLRATWESEN